MISGVALLRIVCCLSYFVTLVLLFYWWVRGLVLIGLGVDGYLVAMTSGGCVVGLLSGWCDWMLRLVELFLVCSVG